MDGKPGKPFQFGLKSIFLLTTVVAAAAWVGGPMCLELAKWGTVGLLIWALMGLHPRTARNS